jgi:type IV pilus assembly protein PilF
MIKCLKISILSAALSCLFACHSQLNSASNERQNNTAQINTQLGMAYLAKNDVERAKQKFLIALDQGPNLPDTWYSMGYYLEVTGEPAQAKKYYLKALSLAPQNGEVQNNYGTFLCRTGDYKTSIKHYLLAIQDPRYLQTAPAYENAGLCALKIPDLNLAATYFNKALLHDPRLTISLLELAKLDYHFGRYPQAQMRLNQYLSYAPPSSQSRLLQSQLSLIHSH